MEPKPGDDKAHLPSPTLWPIGFAIGVACVLVGLIVSWPAVAVGGAIALVFGFLWVRDLSKRRRARASRRRRPSAGAGPAPPATAAAGMPRARAGRAVPAQQVPRGLDARARRA